MIYVFIAPGFEETEAVTSIDMLRRGGQEVNTVGIGDNIITSVHGVSLVTDITDDEIVLDDNLEMIVLPGGMPGTLNLEKSQSVQSAIEYCKANNIYIAAICAAPSILGHLGLLEGKKATCFEGYEQELKGAEVCSCAAVADGKIITGRSAGCSVQFGLLLVEVLSSKEKRNQLEKSLLCSKS